MARRLLLTGFGPFGDVAVNTSERVLAPVAAAAARDWDVATLVLPVSWRRAFPPVRAVLESTPPDALVLLGVHAGLAELRFERQGRRWCAEDRPDDDGEPFSPATLPEDGYGAYFSSAPVQDLVAAACRAGTPARVSDDAGDYLCNHTYYRTLELCERLGLACRVVFVHLPLLPEHAEGRPSLPQPAILAGLAGALASLADAGPTARE